VGALFLYPDSDPYFLNHQATDFLLQCCLVEGKTLKQSEQDRWGHFLVRVRKTPEGTVWEVEALTTGAVATFQSPAELVAFVRANLKPSDQSAPTGRESERL
jgi:hypothetical protein